ncbi:MAG: hypothetical protein AAFV45_07865 [Pseudomonadota bacterium]
MSCAACVIGLGLGIAWLVGAPVQAAGSDINIEGKLSADQKRRYDTCRAQEAERAELHGTGIVADMDKGPAWAKANLPAQRLSQILRYIHLDEQVKFRCGDVFAEVSVIEAEEAARIEAARVVAARKAYEARRAEMLRNIPNPVRKPASRLTRAQTRNNTATPPLPVRFRR